MATKSVQVSQAKLVEVKELRAIVTEHNDKCRRLERQLQESREAAHDAGESLRGLLESLPPALRDLITVNEATAKPTNGKKGSTKTKIPKEEKLEFVRSFVESHGGEASLTDVNKAYSEHFDRVAGPLIGMIREAKEIFKVTGKHRDQVVALKA